MTAANWHAATNSRPLPKGTADRTLLNNRLIMQDTFQGRRSGTGWKVVAALLFLLVAVAIYKNVSATGAAKPVATPAPAVRAIQAEPTTDYSAQIAADNERVKIAEQGQYAAQLEAIAAKQEAVDALARQQAAQVVLIQITQQAEQNQIVAAQIEITRQANDIALADKNNTAAQLRIEQERVNMEASARAVENQRNTLLAKNEAEFGAKKAQADIFFKTALPIAIGFLGLTLFVWLIWTFLYARYIASQPAEQVAEVEDEPEPAFIPPPYVSDLNMKIFNGIVTFDQLTQLARGVQAGVELVHDNWTPASVLMSEGKFQSLQYILEKYGRATWKDSTHKAGIELTPLGCKFFDDILNAPQTTHPLKSPAPKTSSGAANRQIDSSFTPL